jgi:hypothetical protein
MVLEAMMKFSKFAKQALAVAFAGLVAVPAVSHAALINALLTPGVVNELEDRDAERVVDAQGNVVTSGNFQVGYQIQSILRFEDANAAAISDSLASPYKLTSYSELLIAGITGVQTIGGVDVPTNVACAAADAKCALVMAPTGNLGAGVMANLYEGPSFDQNVAPATGIAGVQSNTLITQVGIAKSTDFWFAIVSNNAIPGNQIGAIAAATDARSGQAGQFIFGLSVISNPGGLWYEPQQMTGTFGNQHDVIGNGSAFARTPTGVDSGWLLSSNTLIQFVVPEPGSLALVGALVVAAGVASTRRKQAKA